MLTKLEAEDLVLMRLRSRDHSANLLIGQFTSSERTFGWVFQRIADGANANLSTSIATKIPRLVIVNKHSAQVVASHIEYEIEEFVRLYEKLLAQNQARSKAWCGTNPFPLPWSLWRKRTVAERAKDAGLYEIRGKEDEP